jgi:hypothetical protein
MSDKRQITIIGVSSRNAIVLVDGMGARLFIYWKS